MATTYKVLGQSAPLNNSLADLYVTPVGTAAVCSTLTVCNQGVSTTFRIAVRPSGASILAKHYINYESSINQYDTVYLTLGITLSPTDVISVYSGTDSLSFGLFGSELF